MITTEKRIAGMPHKHYCVIDFVDLNVRRQVYTLGLSLLYQGYFNLLSLFFLRHYAKWIGSPSELLTPTGKEAWEKLKQ